MSMGFKPTTQHFFVESPMSTPFLGYSSSTRSIKKNATYYYQVPGIKYEYNIPVLFELCRPVDVFWGGFSETDIPLSVFS